MLIQFVGPTLCSDNGGTLCSDNGGTFRLHNGGTGHFSKVTSGKLETHSTCVNTVSRLYSSLRMVVLLPQIMVVLLSQIMVVLDISLKSLVVS